MEINQRIVKLLSEKNLTQKELCQNIGVSPSTLNNWLKLNRSIPSEYLIPISEFFNVSVYYLLSDDENIPKLLSNEQQEMKKLLQGIINMLEDSLLEARTILTSVSEDEK